MNALLASAEVHGIDAFLLLGAGLFIGTAAVLIFALDRIEAYRQDCENHAYAALELSKKLGNANGKIAVLQRENEQLTEQADNLIRHADHDPADSWKNTPRDILLPEIEA